MKLTQPRAAPVTIPEDFERLFDRFFGRPLFEPAPRIFETMWTPALDFSEDEKDYIVRLEAPGVPKEDLEVNLDGQLLTISGRREFAQEEKTEEYFWREREQGRFVRTVRLPGAVQPGKVVARYEDGVMTVRLPKAEPTVKTKIAVT